MKREKRKRNEERRDGQNILTEVSFPRNKRSVLMLKILLPYKNKVETQPKRMKVTEFSNKDIKTRLESNEKEN